MAGFRNLHLSQVAICQLSFRRGHKSVANHRSRLLLLNKYYHSEEEREREREKKAVKNRIKMLQIESFFGTLFHSTNQKLGLFPNYIAFSSHRMKLCCGSVPQLNIKSVNLHVHSSFKKKKEKKKLFNYFSLILTFFFLNR